MAHTWLEVVALAVAVGLTGGCRSSRGTAVPSGSDPGRDGTTVGSAVVANVASSDASVAANDDGENGGVGPALSQAQPVTDKDTVVIVNSGSTNAMGYRIEVPRSGQASYQCGDDKGTVSLPADMVTRLYADVASASPLAGLQGRRCAKSVSFGTRTYVQIGDDRSPDISCPGGDAKRVLMADVSAIVQELHLGFRRRQHGRAP